MIYTRDNKKEVFETMPVSKALITMAVPTIISQLVSTVYNIADTAFVGMTNDPYKVASTSLVAVCFFLMNSLANLFGIGGGSMMSRLLGAREEEEARKVCVFSLYGALGLAAIYSLACYVLDDFAVQLLGASDNTAGYAKNIFFG